MFFKRPQRKRGARTAELFFDESPHVSGNHVAVTLMLVLIGLATLAIEMTALDAGQPVWRAAGVACGWMLALLAVRRVLSRNTAWRSRAVPLIVVLLLVLAALPLVQMSLSANGIAPEIVLLLSLRNFGLGVAALAGNQRAWRLCGFIGLCLIIFSVTLAQEGVVLGVAAAYIVAGGGWLACSHWHARQWDSDSTVSNPTPWAAVVAAILVVIGAFAAALAGSERSTTALLGWVPGSGGTGRWSFQARGGVHDQGDAEVGALKDASSVGFADTDVFIESQEVSLYDTFSDTYGNPIPPKEQQRKVVVPFKNFIESHTEPAENHDADEQFSTRRTPPRDNAGKADSRHAKALLYVRGRVPLHLRTTAYDRFDGEQWHREQGSSRSHNLIRESSEELNAHNFEAVSSWMRFSAPELPPYYGGAEEHQVKIGTLRTNRVLAPGRLERFRIGRVGRPDFFKWAHDDILHLDAPRFPPATTFVTHSRMSNPRRLASHKFESDHIVLRSEAFYLSKPGNLNAQVTRLAQEWTRGVPRGWAQIEAVVARLRSHSIHDQHATVPANSADPVGYFLKTRRGPDYLFATTTVLMLRSLGYPARLVSGFYARPERFVARTGHTLVQPEDAHFWPEVLLPRTASYPFDRAWIPLEPTPGYELLPPQLSFWEQGMATLASLADWMRRHAVSLLLLFVSVVWVWCCRHWLADAGATLWWRMGWWLKPRRLPARRVEATLRLLDARGRRAGCPRSPGTTPSRWLTPLLDKRTDESELRVAMQHDLKTLLLLTDHAAFAPPDVAAPYSATETRALCWRIVRGLNLATLKRELKKQ